MNVSNKLEHLSLAGLSRLIGVRPGACPRGEHIRLGLKGLSGTDTNLFLPLINYSRKKFYNIDFLIVVIVNPQAVG
jgi:hypothetical protein